MSALPDKPSELLELAINDALEVEKMPGWELDMHIWLQRFDQNTCSACLAGSVMLRQLGVAPTRVASLLEYGLSLRDEDKVHAINFLRAGDIATALHLLRLTNPLEDYRAIAMHHIDRDAFFADLRKLVTDLREAGL